MLLLNFNIDDEAGADWDDDDDDDVIVLHDDVDTAVVADGVNVVTEDKDEDEMLKKCEV